jgi:hypothetical protein
MSASPTYSSSIPTLVELNPRICHLTQMSCMLVCRPTKMLSLKTSSAQETKLWASVGLQQLRITINSQLTNPSVSRGITHPMELTKAAPKMTTVMRQSTSKKCRLASNRRMNGLVPVTLLTSTPFLQILNNRQAWPLPQPLALTCITRILEQDRHPPQLIILPLSNASVRSNTWELTDQTKIKSTLAVLV